MREGYAFAIENGAENYEELEPLYRKHYGEMKVRLASDGLTIGDYAPRVEAYKDRIRAGGLINYVVRFHGEAVGYSNIYVTNDMHNGEFIAVEDTIYILPEHRNGIGKKLVEHILGDLKSRGVKRVRITPVTDLRVAKIWQRMGFREVATVMQFDF